MTTAAALAAPASVIAPLATASATASADHMLNNFKMNFVLNENAELFFHFLQFFVVVPSTPSLSLALSKSILFHCFVMAIVPELWRSRAVIVCSIFTFSPVHVSLPAASFCIRTIMPSLAWSPRSRFVAHSTHTAPLCVFTVYRKGILNANDQFH